MTDSAENLLKQTTSRCPVCGIECPAVVVRVGGKQAEIHLRKTCLFHGEFTVCISSDARFYWLAKGDSSREGGCCGSSCCASDGASAGPLGNNAAGRGDGPFEKLSTCLALIELVQSCNLACPTCYADSPAGMNHHVDAAPLENLKERVQGVINRKGKIEILQLSGGEPTLHPEFFEFVDWAQANPGIDYLLLNTNGVRIARDPAFAERLDRTVKRGKFQLYLQFDGVQETGQRELRGLDLRQLREDALARCQEMRLPVTLAMTVVEENLPHLWAAIEFGLRYPHVRGISFQPRFDTGRVVSPTRPRFGRVDRRLNTADIILAAVGQSGGVLKFEDFTPLPCGDPNCATIGYLLKIGERIASVSDFIDFGHLQSFLQNKVFYDLKDLAQCGCESEPLGDLLKHFELDESHTFRLFIKPFMDAWTWDEDRIDRCCTHVIRPDGRLDSFCRYYADGGGARKFAA